MNSPQNVTTLDPILRVPFMERYDEPSGIKRDNAVEKYWEENPELADLPDETRRTIEKLIQQARDKVLEDKGHPVTGKTYFDAAWYFNMELDYEKWEARIRNLPEMEMLDKCDGHYVDKMNRLSVHQRAVLYYFGQTKGNSLTEREFDHVSNGEMNCSIRYALLKNDILSRKKIKTKYTGKMSYSVTDERFHRWLIYRCGGDYHRTNIRREAKGERVLTVSEYIADPTPEPWRRQFNALESQRRKTPLLNALKRIPCISEVERAKILELLECAE